MRRLMISVTLVLFLCISALGQQQVTISLNGYSRHDTLAAGCFADLALGFLNLGDDTFKVVSQSFKIWSPDGAQWDSLSAPACMFLCPTWDVATGSVMLDHDGVGTDLVWFGGAADFGGLMPQTHYPMAMNLHFKTRIGDLGKTICIDSAMVAPAGKATWSWWRRDGSRVLPEWRGSKCYTIGLPATPEFADCRDTIFGEPNGNFSIPYHVRRAPCQNLHFAIVSGPGVIDDSRGIWNSGNLAPGGYSLVVSVTDGYTADTCATMVIVRSARFHLVCPGDQSAYAGQKVQFVLYVDPAVPGVEYRLADAGGVTGEISGWLRSGWFEYTPSDHDAQLPQPVRMRFVASDGTAADTCEIRWTILPRERYRVAISPVWEEYFSREVTVPIQLLVQDTLEGVGGFNFLVAFWDRVLSLQNVTKGAIYDSCEWEYFTYRYGAIGNCSACPTGLVRVVGLADINDGGHHPGCQPLQTGQLPVELANLHFLVSDNPNYDGLAVPIRFIWTECVDNVLVNPTGTVFNLGTGVVEPGSYPLPGTADQGYPNYFGPGEECMSPRPGTQTMRSVRFRDGYVGLYTDSDIDEHGDVNLNGLPYEMADAEMFAQYFLKGVTAFVPYPLGRIAASDVNRDGVPVTPADYMMLRRVAWGKTLELVIDSLVTDFSHDGGVFSVGTDRLGVFVMIVEGNDTPELLADNAVMRYATDSSGNTHILIESPIPHPGRDFIPFGHELVRVNGTLISAEAATTDGRKVVWPELPLGVDEGDESLPLSFAMAQNYPNPFNPSTTISYDLPQAGVVELAIFNTNGQRVRHLVSEQKSAGRYTVEWDGKDDNHRSVASGVYFYRLDAGKFVSTKKMLLIK